MVWRDPLPRRADGLRPPGLTAARPHPPARDLRVTIGRQLVRHDDDDPVRAEQVARLRAGGAADDRRRRPRGARSARRAGPPAPGGRSARASSRRLRSPPLTASGRRRGVAVQSRAGEPAVEADGPQRLADLLVGHVRHSRAGSRAPTWRICAPPPRSSRWPRATTRDEATLTHLAAPQRAGSNPARVNSRVDLPTPPGPTTASREPGPEFQVEPVGGAGERRDPHAPSAIRSSSSPLHAPAALHVGRVGVVRTLPPGRPGPDRPLRSACSSPAPPPLASGAARTRTPTTQATTAQGETFTQRDAGK